MMEYLGLIYTIKKLIVCLLKVIFTLFLSFDIDKNEILGQSQDRAFTEDARISLFSAHRAARDPITKQSYSARNLRRAWASGSSQGEEKGSLCPGYI